MNRKLVLYSLFCFFCFFQPEILLCQNFSFSAFENEKDSLQRIEMGNESWSYYVRNNIDSLETVGLLMVNEDSAGLYGVGIRNLGSYQVRGKDINKGIELLEDAREIFLVDKAVVHISETENELGNAYFLLGDYRQAARYYLASIVHGSVSSDATASYNGMIGIGKTVCAKGDTTRGLLFIQEFLERALRDSKYEAAADACGFLGMIAGQDGKIELMSAYYRRGVLYSDKSNSVAHQASAITNKAIDYFYQNKTDSALQFFYESLKIREAVGATRPIVESLYNLAILYIETNDLEKAKEFAKQGEVLSSERGIRSWQIDCLKLLLEIAEKNNDHQSVEPIQLDIERIQNELDEMGSLDNEIIDLAVDFTSLHDSPIRRSRFWEIVMMIVILLCSAMLIYTYRSSSVSADVPT